MAINGGNKQFFDVTGTAKVNESKNKAGLEIHWYLSG